MKHPANYQDLTGQTFGRWTVLERVIETPRRYRTKWRCRCECGTEKVLFGDSVKSGRSQSCGCLHSEIISRHGKWKTTEYGIFQGIHQRCENPKSPGFHRYGGRGIKVCDRWSTFENFLADMGNRPEGMSLDRIDNDGDYSPENCRWATPLEQSRNRCDNLHVTFRGETRTLKEWAKIVGIKYVTIQGRLRTGWSMNDALSLPPDRSRKLMRSNVK